MDGPDHRVFWIECVAPCFHEVVKIRTVEVRSAIHALLLLLAPGLRHRHVERDGYLRWSGLHHQPDLIAIRPILEDARTLLPLVSLSHPRLRNRSHVNCPHVWQNVLTVRVGCGFAATARAALRTSDCCETTASRSTLRLCGARCLIFLTTIVMLRVLVLNLVRYARLPTIIFLRN